MSKPETLTRNRKPIAVVGMACVFPGAMNIDEYWANIVTGTGSFSVIPADRVNPAFYDRRIVNEPLYCTTGAFLDSHLGVETKSLGFMPKAVDSMEPDQVIALSVAEDAIKDSGAALDTIDRSRIGVILGKGGYPSPGQIRSFNRLRAPLQVATSLRNIFPEITLEQEKSIYRAFSKQQNGNPGDEAIGMISNMAASRIANRFDFGGPAYLVDGACASSLLAVDNAMTLIDSGRCDALLVGGVHHCQDISMWNLFNRIGALSKSGRMVPFGKDADGTLLGEGTGIVVLKSLEAARKNNDRIYAVIDGVGVSSDGHSTSVINPNPEAQQVAIRRAWDEAGVDPRKDPDIRLLEAHGTSTVKGDEAELQSISNSFGIKRRHDNSIVLGSVKTLIGHTMAAAGIAGLIKVCLALYNRILPPLGHSNAVLDAVGQKGLRTLPEAIPWEPNNNSSVQRAGVDAFGFGGVNTHVALSLNKENTFKNEKKSFFLSQKYSRKVRIFAASTVQELIGKLSKGLREGAIDDTYLNQFNAPRYRVAIFKPDSKKLSLAISALKGGMNQFVTRDIAVFCGSLQQTTQIAAVFPGLEPTIESRVSDLLTWSDDHYVPSYRGGIVDQARRLYNSGLAVYDAFQASHIYPSVLVGASMGEITASTAAGVIGREDMRTTFSQMSDKLLGVVNKPFALLAASRDTVELLIQDSGLDVVLTHDNSPTQCLVSGTETELLDFLALAKEKGIRGRTLNMRSGFHTSSMDPVGEWLKEVLVGHVAKQNVELWSSSTSRRVGTNPEDQIDAISRCLVKPVNFTETIQALYKNGIQVFIQMGSGTTSAIIDQILGKKPHLSIAGNDPNKSGCDQILWVENCLWAAGLHVDTRENLRSTTIKSLKQNQDLATREVKLGTPLIGLDSESTGAIREIIQHAVYGQRCACKVKQETEKVKSSLPYPQAPLQLCRGDEKHYKIEVNLQDMPYLIDHSFIRQPDGWPDDSDRYSVMPGTATLELLETLVRKETQELIISTEDLRLTRIISACPPTMLDMKIQQTQHRAAASIEKFASIQTTLANRYPSCEAERESIVETEWPSRLTAEEYYEKRMLFHGPEYQVIHSITALGEHHIRGLLKRKKAPGSLLDGAGQLLGCWVMEIRTTNLMVLPMSIEKIQYYSDFPQVGELVDCFVSIKELTDSVVRADIQLVYQDKIWAVITNWTSRRFKGNPKIYDNTHWPEKTVLSDIHGKTWASFTLSGDDLQDRKSMMSNYLPSEERKEYDHLSPMKKRTWLAGRIAAKDMLRSYLWEEKNAGSIFPAQIAISNRSDGAPFVKGRNGFNPGSVQVSIAHCDSTGVAIAGEKSVDGGGPGIDIARIKEFTDDTMQFAFSDEDRHLIAHLVETTDKTISYWGTVFWAVKEAAAKTVGGLHGKPKSFHVFRVDSIHKMAEVHYKEEILHIQYSAYPEYFNADYMVAWTPIRGEQ